MTREEREELGCRVTREGAALQGRKKTQGDGISVGAVAKEAAEARARKAAKKRQQDEAFYSFMRKEQRLKGAQGLADPLLWTHWILTSAHEVHQSPRCLQAHTRAVHQRPSRSQAHTRAVHWSPRCICVSTSAVQRIVCHWQVCTDALHRRARTALHCIAEAVTFKYARRTAMKALSYSIMHLGKRVQTLVTRLLQSLELTMQVVRHCTIQADGLFLVNRPIGDRMHRG